MLFGLRSGNFYWKFKTPYPSKDSSKNRPKNEIHDFDIAVIGAGISGALCAEKLSQLGMSVCIIDKNRPASGSTKACTAIIQYDTDLLLHKLSKKIGKQSATHVYEAGIEAIDKLKELSKDCVGQAEFRNCSSILLAHTDAEVLELKKELEIRKEVGLQVEFLNQDEIKNDYPFVALHALRSQQAASLNPVSLTEGLIASACKRGAKLFTGCKVLTETFNKNSTVTLECSNKRIFNVKRVVYACGYLTAKRLGLDIGKLTSSYAGCTNVLEEPIESWKDHAVVWEVARPYTYLRRTYDNRIIIGGKDKPFKNTFLRNALMPYEKLALQNKAREMAANKKLSLEYFWSGTFAESEDSLPYIGEIPGKQNCFAVMGTGGNGVTFSVFAHDIIEDWIKSRPLKLGKLFALNR